jgi:transcriptional regulator with XRE-family HTH domain
LLEVKDAETGKIIKMLRHEKKYSQKELAEKLQVAQNTISNWEQGTREPDNQTLIVLAQLFNVSVDYLLGKTVFKKHTELFEHWGGHNNPNFEAAFDFGDLLRIERERQGISQQEVSETLGITESDVDDIEYGTLPLNYEWAEKYANFLGTSVHQIFIDNGMGASLHDIPLELFHHYQDLGMSETEMVSAFSKFRADEYKDAISDFDIGNYEHETIAAHHDGEDWTEEELKEIEQFKQFVRMKRQKEGQ